MDLNIDSVHLAWRCGTEDQTRRVVSDLEGALAEAKARRDKILADIRKANEAAFAGDKRQLFALTGKGGLNQQEAAVGRLILSIAAQLQEARKWLATIEAHAATAAARRASADDAVLVRDKVFEVETPDGRRVRHHHATADSLQRMLQPGYKVVAEVQGAGIDGKGGMVEALGQSTMKTLLAAHGADLLAFLEAHGFRRDGKAA
jgi:hypothetical protein